MRSAVIAEYNRRYTLRELAARLSIPHRVEPSYEKVRKALSGDSPFSLDQIYIWFRHGNDWQREFATKLAAEQYPGVSLGSD